jgi:FKBP-type peptidyl-prolyl cis-trans isomerase SlyD
MKIAPGKVVTLAFDLCNEAGEIIEASEITGQVSFVHGKGAIIPGLDQRLVGMAAGEESDFTFAPAEAFGTTEGAPTKTIARAEFPRDAALARGTAFEAGLPGGQKVKLVVDTADDKNVTVRMVHPLAGQTVKMSVKIAAVREATPQELATGKVMTKPPPPPRKS